MNHESLDQDTTSNPWTKKGLFDDVKFAGNKTAEPEKAESKTTDPETTTPSEEEKTKIAERLENIQTTSEDHTCGFYIRFIERRGKMGAVKSLISEELSARPKSYGSLEEFEEDNPDYIEDVSKSLTPEEQFALHHYTGYTFAQNNSVARGFWDYEKLGPRTPEREARVMEENDTISRTIDKTPAPQKGFIAYRGTNLDGFRGYGIHSIADLAKLRNGFMLDKGFISTSIVRENSFADQEEGGYLIGASNIEVRYHVPANYRTGVGLFTRDLSHTPEETEYLINSQTLMFVSEVTFDKEGHAIIDAIVIPKEVYDNPQQ